MKHLAIFGVPRSGTSWLGQIFNSSTAVAYRFQPLLAYSFPFKLSTNSTNKEIAEFYYELLKTSDEFVCQKKNVSGNETPKFNKNKITHLVWKEVRYLEIIENLIKSSNTKIIGIIRHPCGVLNSWVNAPKEFNTDWNIEEEWRYAKKKNKTEHDYYGYERWINAVEMFLDLEQKYPTKFALVIYENLLSDLNTEIQRLFDFVGLQVNTQTKQFLIKSSSSSSEDPYGVYRINKKGDCWKKALPNSIIQEIMMDKRFQNIYKELFQ